MKPAVGKALKSLLRRVVLDKLDKYKAETEYKPFFNTIFPEEDVMTASVMHSFYTSLGMSVYEQMAKILAEGVGYKAEKQYELLGEIDPKTESLITSIHSKLRKGSTPNKSKETVMIAKSIVPGKPLKDPDSIVDIFIKKPNGEEYYFDITSAKPNKKEFEVLKRKLLRWTALRLSQKKDAKVFSAIAIPYNPYHPKPYSRWTAGNMYDKSEMLIGKGFWNFVAGEDVYDELIKVFQEIGDELKEEIKEIAKKDKKVQKQLFDLKEL